MLRRSLTFALLGTWLAAPAQQTATTGQPPQPPTQTIHITADLTQAIGPAKPIYSWFGYDEANYTTTANGRAVLGELHDLSPVPVSIRVHHLLTSGDGTPELKWSSTGVYRESADGAPVYDFRVLDAIFDAFRDTRVRPMVELGFMPQDLAAILPGQSEDHPPYQVHFPKDVTAGRSNNPPRSYERWQELTRVVTQHLVERYGRANVAQWYFEVWNEPDISYWHGSPEDYWKLYDYAVAGLRQALPEARVGGPASTSPRSDKAYNFLHGFLDHVVNGRSAANGEPVPLDFISFHAKGSPKIVDGAVTMGIAEELRDADRGFALIASYPRLKPLPIILSEADPEGCAACSSRMNPANNYRNGTLYPAYTAAVYPRLFELADHYGVNLLGMLSWSFEFEGRDYFEGFRSLSTNGIDKPILNFFRMAAGLKGSRVATTSDGAIAQGALEASGVRQSPDVGAMATRSGREAAMLLWNYRDQASSAAAAPIAVRITGLPRTLSHIQVTEQRIDAEHSNAYTVWQSMGSPQQPSAAQIAELKRRAGLETVGPPRTVSVQNGTATLATTMPAQSVGFLRCTW